MALCRPHPRRCPFFSDMCLEGGSQAQVFVMSSLGSFWFNCSLLLFHAVLLSNSNGLVTTVLPLSSSVQPTTPCQQLASISFTYSLHPPRTSSPVSCCMYKIQMLTTKGGAVDEVEGACMNGHGWPIPFIPVREREQPLSAAPHLTPFPQQTSVVRLGLMFPHSDLLELYSRSIFLLSLQNHQHYLHTFFAPYVISQLFYPSRAFSLKLRDATLLWSHIHSHIQ